MAPPPETLWICHSRQDDGRCDELRRDLEAAGHKVGCAQRLEAGSDAQGEVARGLRESDHVVVLACAELLADQDWPAAERALRERAGSVVVVRLRAHLCEWTGFRAISAPESGFAARVLLRLRGAQAPERTRYRERLRQQHEKVPLWRLREDEAQGTSSTMLSTLYVPPSLLPEGEAQPCQPEALLEMKPRRLLVRGEPGLGKSSLLHHLLLQALKQPAPEQPVLLQALEKPAPEQPAPEQPALLPVWLTATSAAAAADLEAHLLAEMERQDPVGRWLLEDALADGTVLLLMDGLDEVAQDQQQRLTRALCSFGDRWNGVRMVMTTRPQAQVQVTDAQVLDLLGLEHSQSALLWSRLGEVTGHELPTFMERWESWSAQLRDLAQIPLLLILLRQVELDQALRSRVQVYHEALVLLEKRWGALRGQTAARPAPTSALREGLERIALHMQDEGKESLPRAKLERLLRKALGPQEGDRALGEAIDVGLLQPAEPGALAFLHATFREYLAARALLEDDERWRAHLPRLRSEARWREVLYLAVAQLGVVENDEASADQWLREVLEGEPQTMGEVLFGPLCLVGGLLAEGVGASRALQAEVLERLRAVWCLKVGAVEEVLTTLSEQPELPWDSAWHGMAGGKWGSLYDTGRRLTAWLAARCEPAWAACTAALDASGEPSPGSYRPAPVLAALGLVMAGDLSPRVLDALAGWRTIPEDAASRPGAGHELAERLTQQALRGAAQQRSCPPWGRALLETVRLRLRGSEERSAVGAAWLLAAADVADQEVIAALWRSSTSTAATGERQRSQKVLVRLANRAPRVEQELFERWQRDPCGPDPSSEWLTEHLKRRPAHRARVVERLLDLVEGEEAALGEWAVKQLGERWPSHAVMHDQIFNVAVRRRVLAAGPRSAAAQSRLDGLFYAGGHLPEVWLEVLRARMADGNPPEVRFRAGRMVARLSSDEAALPGLIAGFAVDAEDAAFWLGQVIHRQPTLREKILEETRRALAVLPPRGCYEAATYLYWRKELSWEEVVHYGVAFLGESQGYHRLPVVEALRSSVDREKLSLALVPLVDEKVPHEAQRLLGALRPQSEEVLLAFLDKLRAVPMESLAFYPRERWIGCLAEMLWRVPALVDCVLKRLDDPETRPAAMTLLQVAARAPAAETPDEHEHQQATLAAQALRESLLDRLATEPPQRTWLLLGHVLSDSGNQEQRVHAALHRCLADPSLSARRLRIAQRLEFSFDEPGPLIKLERERLAGEGMADPADRLQAALCLEEHKCLGDTEMKHVVGLLSASLPSAVRIGAAGLLIRAKAAASLLDSAGAALLECLENTNAATTAAPWDFTLSAPLTALARESRCGPRTIAGQAAFLLFELPSFHETLTNALLLWLRGKPHRSDSEAAAVILTALRVDPARVAPICCDILQTPDGFAVLRGFLLGLRLGVDAHLMLPSLIVTLLRRGSGHAQIAIEHDEAEADGSVQKAPVLALQGQLRFLQAWHVNYLLEDLREQANALINSETSREMLLEAFAAALVLAGPQDEEARVRVAAARLALSGATEADYELLATSHYYRWDRLISLAPGNQIVNGAWGRSASRRDESSFGPLWYLVEHEKEVPGAARAHLEPLLASWLADDSPSFRVEALATLAELGWLTPAHAAPLRLLLNSERRLYDFYEGATIRRRAASILAQHYPEQAGAVHEPLLEMISGGWINSVGCRELQECITTLQTARCPHVRIVDALTVWLNKHASGLNFVNLEFVAFLNKASLYAALEDVYGDWLLRTLQDYSPHLVDDYLPADALRLEDGEGTTIDGTKAQRLAALPDLLCRTLARRLGLLEEHLQALWHELTLPNEPAAHSRIALARVLHFATDQAELRPFLSALIERWDSSRRMRSRYSGSS